MNIDYKQEIIKMMNDNEITTMPSVELISSDEDIAVAAWKSFTYYYNPDYKDFDLNTWYSSADWGNTLSSYKDNINFWEKALSAQNFQYEILLLESFKKDFPLIANQYLKNNDKLIDLLYTTNNIGFFNLIKLSIEEKIKLFKEYLIKNDVIQEEHIIKYENDDNFVKEVLNKRAYLFKHLNTKNKSNHEYIMIALEKNSNLFESLNEENKANPIYIDLAIKQNPSIYKYLNEKNKHENKYIQLAIKDVNSFLQIPKELQEQYFPAWLELHKDEKLNLQLFSYSQQEKILENKVQLLPGLLTNSFEKYKGIAIKAISKDFRNGIERFSIDVLTKLYKSNNNIELIRPSLESFIQNYNDVDKLSNVHNKMIELIKLDKELQDKLSNNIFYEIMTKLSSDGILLPDFEYYYNKIDEMVKSEEIDEGKANNILNRLKGKLPIDVLKEEKMPKDNLYNFLNKRKLKSDLEEELNIGQKKKSLKI